MIFQVKKIILERLVLSSFFVLYSKVTWSCPRFFQHTLFITSPWQCFKININLLSLQRLYFASQGRGNDVALNSTIKR